MSITAVVNPQTLSMLSGEPVNNRFYSELKETQARLRNVEQRLDNIQAAPAEKKQGFWGRALSKVGNFVKEALSFTASVFTNSVKIFEAASKLKKFW